MARGPRFWALGVDSGPRGGAFEGVWDPPKTIKNTCIFISAQHGLRINPPGYFSLIYAAFIKPGPLGKLRGQTLAENRPKTTKKLKYLTLPTGPYRLFKRAHTAPTQIAPHAIGPPSAGDPIDQRRRVARRWGAVPQAGCRSRPRTLYNS